MNYIIETVKTYDGVNFHTHYFQGMSKIIPSLMFTPRISEAAKYPTKQRAKKAIKNFRLDKGAICSVIKFEGKE